MMISFYEIHSIWQILLLVLSLLTVICLIGTCTVSFRYRDRSYGPWYAGAVLVINMILYVLMQLASRITGGEEAMPLQIPYVVLFAVTLSSFGYGVRTILRETKNRKTIGPGSIKESFDNLPIGVCFFNEAGLPVLCNLAMHRFSFEVCGKDIQFVTDLQVCLADDFAPVDGVSRDGSVFALADGTAWRLEERVFEHKNGETYTQYIAADVTDLYRTREELIHETQQLRRSQMELKKLSANVVAITREEEILNTKMRVHDEMGRCLVAAQKYLREDSMESIPDSVVQSWQRAVSMIKYNNETPDEDMLAQIRKACDAVNLRLVQSGDLPGMERVAYLLTCAVRECVTNAVRYAEASELYVNFAETERTAAVTVTNNGKCPEQEIVEGGGLSTLRRRVERSGGTMTIQSLPQFQLTVIIPKGKEEMI